MNYHVNNYLHELHLSTLIEDEREKYKEQLKKFFPSIWNNIKGNFQTLIPAFTTTMKDENEMIKRYIKNLDVEIRLHHSPKRNAYTYPAITKKGIATGVNLLPIFGTLYFIINGFNWLSNNKNFLTTGKSDGTIITFPPNTLKILAFQTKGLYTDLEERQRIAVMLHEIGHWNFLPHTLTSIFSRVASSALFLIPPVSFALLIIALIFTRKSEYDSDKFAKMYGYGEDLHDALDRIILRPRKDVNWINKINDWITKILGHIQNGIERILPIYGHPSVRKRKAELSDGLIYEQLMYHEQLNLLEQYLLDEGMIKDALLNIIAPVTKKLDSIVGDKLEILFPIK